MAAAPSPSAGEALNATPPVTTPAPAAAPAAASAAQPPAPAPWYGTVDDETKGWIENKHYGSPADVIKAARNAEKLLGLPADRVLKLPDQPRSENPEAWKDIDARTGVPGKPEDYKLAGANGAFDDAFALKMAGVMHQAGVSVDAAKALNEVFVSELATMQTEALAENERQTMAAIADLKNEWGNAFDARWQMARNAATRFGIDVEAIDGIAAIIGPKKAYSFLANIGQATGEASFVQGNQSQTNFGMTPAQAKAKITELQNDHAKGGWVERYLNAKSPDAPERTQLAELIKISISGDQV